MSIKPKELFLPFLILSSMLVLMANNKGDFIFLLNTFLVFLLICKTKISLFSIKAIILYYILVPLFSQYYFNSSYGILQKSNSIKKRNSNF